MLASLFIGSFLFFRRGGFTGKLLVCSHLAVESELDEDASVIASPVASSSLLIVALSVIETEITDADSESDWSQESDKLFFVSKIVPLILDLGFGAGHGGEVRLGFGEQFISFPASLSAGQPANISEKSRLIHDNVLKNIHQDSLLKYQETLKTGKYT